MKIAYLNSQQHQKNDILRSNRQIHNNISCQNTNKPTTGLNNNNVITMANKTHSKKSFYNDNNDSESLLLPPAQISPFHLNTTVAAHHNSDILSRPELRTSTPIRSVSQMATSAMTTVSVSRPERNLWHLNEILHMLNIMRSINAVEMLKDKTLKSERIFRKVERIMHKSGFFKKSHVQILTKWKFLKSTYTTTRRNGTIPKMIAPQVYNVLHEMLSCSRSVSNSECGNSVTSFDGGDNVNNSLDHRSHQTMIISGVEGGYNVNNDNNNQNSNASPIDEDFVSQTVENSLSMEHPIFGCRLGGVVKQELADTGYETATTDNGHTIGNTTTSSDHDPLDDPRTQLEQSRSSSLDQVQFRMDIKQEPEETIAPITITSTTSLSQAHPVAIRKMISPPLSQKFALLEAATTTTNNVPHSSTPIPSLRIATFAKEPSNLCSSLLIDRSLESPANGGDCPPMPANQSQPAHLQSQIGDTSMMPTRKSSRIVQQSTSSSSSSSYTNTTQTHKSLNEILLNNKSSASQPPILHPTTVGEVQILPIHVPKDAALQQRIPPPVQPQSISIRAGPPINIVPRSRSIAPRKGNTTESMPPYPHSQMLIGGTSNSNHNRDRIAVPSPSSPYNASHDVPHVSHKHNDTVGATTSGQSTEQTMRTRKRRLNAWNDTNETKSASRGKNPEIDKSEQPPNVNDTDSFQPSAKEVEFFDSALNHLSSSMRQLQREMIAEFFQSQMEFARKEHEFQMAQDMQLISAFKEQSRTLLKSTKDLFNSGEFTNTKSKENPTQVVEINSPPSKRKNYVNSSALEVDGKPEPEKYNKTTTNLENRKYDDGTFVGVSIEEPTTLSNDQMEEISFEQLQQQQKQSHMQQGEFEDCSDDDDYDVDDDDNNDDDDEDDEGDMDNDDDEADIDLDDDDDDENENGNDNEEEDRSDDCGDASENDEEHDDNDNHTETNDYNNGDVADGTSYHNINFENKSVTETNETKYATNHKEECMVLET